MSTVPATEEELAAARVPCTKHDAIISGWGTEPTEHVCVLHLIFFGGKIYICEKRTQGTLYLILAYMFVGVHTVYNSYSIATRTTVDIYIKFCNRSTT